MVYSKHDMRDSYKVGYTRASSEYKKVLVCLCLVFIIIIIALI